MIQNGHKIRSDLVADSRIYGRNAPDLSQGAKGAITGVLNEYLGSDENRRIVLSWVFRGKARLDFTSKKLTNGQWFALQRWVGQYKDDDGWHTRPNFAYEAMVLLRVALRSFAAGLFGVDSDGMVAEIACLPGLKVISEHGEQEQSDHQSD